MKTYQGHIVDVVSREVFYGEIVVDGGRIRQVNRCPLPDNGKAWPYLMPGFIDSHVHIESSMMTPSEFAHVATTHGTIGVVADPHESGNVLGIKGVDYMKLLSLIVSRLSPLRKRISRSMCRSVICCMC
jgi:adenine deaminase